jgi:hypothetical protein
MNYYEKYLKYKTKYFKLKNMNGGNIIIEQYIDENYINSTVQYDKIYITNRITKKK